MDFSCLDIDEGTRRSLAQQADPARLGVLWEGALQEGGQGEDCVAQDKERTDYQPIELVEEDKVWLAIKDKTPVRVQDKDAAEDDAEDKCDDVDIADGVAGTYEDATEERSVGRVGLQEGDPDS